MVWTMYNYMSFLLSWVRHDRQRHQCSMSLEIKSQDPIDERQGHTTPDGLRFSSTANSAHFHPLHR